MKCCIIKCQLEACAKMKQNPSLDAQESKERNKYGGWELWLYYCNQHVKGFLNDSDRDILLEDWD